MTNPDFERVLYDKNLHRLSNKHWHSWYNSKEHAVAFQKYYREGTVPHRKYPAPLVKHHSKAGTVSFVELEGNYNWKNEERRHEFKTTAIYNKKLSEWASKQHPSNIRRQLVFNIQRIIALVCVIFTLLYLMNSWGVMHNIPLFVLIIVFAIGAIVSFWSMVKYDGVIWKILYFIYGCTCAFICLCFFGVIPIDAGFAISVLVPLVIVLLVIYAIGLVFLFMRFFIPSLAIGGGLVFGGVSGWKFAKILFGKK